MGDRPADQIRLDQQAQIEQLADLVGREHRDHGPAMGHDGDQAFALQQTQGLAQGNAAHPELGRQHLLAKLGPCLQRAGKDAHAQLLGRRFRHRLALEDRPACKNHDSRYPIPGLS